MMVAILFLAVLGAALATLLLRKIKGETDTYFRYDKETGKVDYAHWDPSEITGIELSEEDIPVLEQIQGSANFDDIAEFLKSKC